MNETKLKQIEARWHNATHVSHPETLNEIKADVIQLVDEIRRLRLVLTEHAMEAPPQEAPQGHASRLFLRGLCQEDRMWSLSRESSARPRETGASTSGVKITFEPSAGMLESIDQFAKESGCTREQAAAAYAALGLVSKRATKILFGAITETAKKIEAGEYEADYRVQELRLTEATGKKSAFEEAAKVCDGIAAEYKKQDESGYDHDHDPCERVKGAEACAEEIRGLKKKFIDEATARLKVKPEKTRPTPEGLARFFHETYEALAPNMGYETREASRKPWEDVPEKNRKLMVAVCERVLLEALP